MTVRTRFAPSPRGLLHIGGARTALFSWLYARRHGGDFVLRIEDTDRERSTDESVQAIMDGMHWLGFDWDEGPIFQTKRFDRYLEIVDQLLKEDKAYHCYCTREELDAVREEQMANKQKPRYNGACRHRTEPREGVTPVVRFRNPDAGSVVFDDAVYGRIEVANSELDDLIIVRSDGSPTYNFCVVIDDWDMKISHVIRGDDHINNTPRQINMFRALGAPEPTFAHLPMILGDDGKRLSKRHGAVGVMAYRDEGYLPEAVLNYLVRLGWSHGDQEIFSLEEMKSLFGFDSVGRGGSVFNTEKLGWLNGQYIKQADKTALADLLTEYLAARGVDVSAGPAVTDVVELLRERANTLVSMADQATMFYSQPQGYDEKAVKKHLKAAALTPLQAIGPVLQALDTWDAEGVHAAIQQVVDQLSVGFGKVALPLRIVTTGGTASPDLAPTLAVLGRDETLRRLEAGVAFVASKSAE